MSLAPNPYQPPQTNIGTVQSTDGTLLLEPNRRPAGAGTRWLTAAWQIFKQRMGLFLGVFWTYVAVVMLLSFIPLLNILVGFLGVFFTAGFSYLAHQVANGRPVTFKDSLIGFQKGTTNLLLLILMIIAASIIAMIPLIIVMGGMFFSMMANPEAVLDTTLGLGALLGVLVSMLFLIPVGMMAWLAPVLVILHDMDAVSAMKLSFKAGVKNILPMLVFGIVVAVVALFASIPLGLGLIVAMPLFALTNYTGYRDMLTNQTL